MSEEKYIALSTLCTCYKVEMTLFNNLSENGLLQIYYVDDNPCIDEELVGKVEKFIRLSQDLKINVAGIDTIFNLLDKMTEMETEIKSLKTRLGIYER